MTKSNSSFTFIEHNMPGDAADEMDLADDTLYFAKNNETPKSIAVKLKIDVSTAMWRCTALRSMASALPSSSPTLNRSEVKK